MVTRRQIQAYVTAVARQFKPQRIILFGSYAYGQPTCDSDVDLLVIMRHRKRNVEKAIEISRTVDAPFPMDLLVRTPAEVTKRLRWGDFFLREIMENGKVMYEAANA